MGHWNGTIVRQAFVALVTVNAKRHGVSAGLPEVHVWRLKNGKATELCEYQGGEQREDRSWSIPSS